MYYYICGFLENIGQQYQPGPSIYSERQKVKSFLFLKNQVLGPTRMMQYVTTQIGLIIFQVSHFFIYE